MFPEAALTAHTGLFLAAFLAATLLPAQSELLLAGLLASGNHNPAFLIAVATFGNVLWSTVNWGLGRYFTNHREARWFPVSAQALEKAEQGFSRHGPWVLLLSWVPIIGDPLTVLAGMLRTHLLPFVAIVTLAKLGRYLVVGVPMVAWT